MREDLVLKGLQRLEELGVEPERLILAACELAMVRESVREGLSESVRGHPTGRICVPGCREVDADPVRLLNLALDVIRRDEMPALALGLATFHQDAEESPLRALAASPRAITQPRLLLHFLGLVALAERVDVHDGVVLDDRLPDLPVDFTQRDVKALADDLLSSFEPVEDRLTRAAMGIAEKHIGPLEARIRHLDEAPIRELLTEAPPSDAEKAAAAEAARQELRRTEILFRNAAVRAVNRIGQLIARWSPPKNLSPEAAQMSATVMAQLALERGPENPAPVRSWREARKELRKRLPKRVETSIHTRIAGALGVDERTIRRGLGSDLDTTPSGSVQKSRLKFMGVDGARKNAERSRKEVEPNGKARRPDERERSRRPLGKESADRTPGANQRNGSGLPEAGRPSVLPRGGRPVLRSGAPVHIDHGRKRSPTGRRGGVKKGKPP